MNEKSVLVIDTPSTCEECILYNVTYYPDKNKKENICYKHCPLKPLPKKKKSYMAELTQEDYDSLFPEVKGWNACLDEISGETE